MSQSYGVSSYLENLIYELFFRTAGRTFYVALITSSVPPDPTKTLGEHQEIAAGNGYVSGGIQLSSGTVDFPNVSYDEVTGIYYVDTKEISWIAAGGRIPPSGANGAYLVLTDDNVVVADRKILAWDYAGKNAYANNGNSITYSQFRMRSISIW